MSYSRTAMSTCASNTEPVGCLRCGGYLYRDRVIDADSPFHEDHVGVLVWVCLHCGDLIDPVILANRARGVMRTTYCECGCGEELPWYSVHGTRRRFAQGHQTRKFVSRAR